MANSALIDDLHRQFAENPRRVFARLANEYRKAGEYETAIEICRAHVPLQPTYISGYIVLGQALYESGQMEEARGTFETALGLDPENLIALRQLGDIARAGGDISGARAWYRRLLEVDPQNEEIAAQLQELDAPAAATPTADKGADTGAGTVTWSDINPESAAPTAPAPAAAPSSPAPTPDQSPVSGLDFDFDALSAFGSDEAAAEPATPPQSGTIEGFTSDIFASPMSRPSDRTHAPSQAAASPSREADIAHRADEPPSVQEPSTAPRSESAPSAFVTETMAELYLQQGHREAALQIYRQLAVQRPGDDSIREAIARLERPAPSAEPARTVRAFFGRLSHRRPPSTTPTATEPAAPAATGPVAEPRAEAPVEEAPPPLPVAALEVAAEAAPAAVSEPATSPESAAPEPTVAVAVPVVEEPPTQAPAHETLGRPKTEEIEAMLFGLPSETETPPPIPEPAASAEHMVAPEPAAPAEPVAAATSEAPVVESSPGAEERPEVPSVAASASAGLSDLSHLFPTASASPEDEQAAATLAGAYGKVEEPAPVSSGRPARTATDSLSLDHVFRHNAGAEAGSEGAGVSFDQFFSHQGEAPAPPASGTGAAGGGKIDGDNDLELFHAWLEGLKK